MWVFVPGRKLGDCCLACFLGVTAWVSLGNCCLACLLGVTVWRVSFLLTGTMRCWKPLKVEAWFRLPPFWNSEMLRGGGQEKERDEKLRSCSLVLVWLVCGACKGAETCRARWARVGHDSLLPPDHLSMCLMSASVLSVSATVTSRMNDTSPTAAAIATV